MAIRKRSVKHYSRRQSAREQRKKFHLTFLCVTLLLMFTAGFLFFRLHQLNQQERIYQAHIEQVQAAIDNEHIRKDELLSQSQKTNSKESIESEARSKLNYVYPDEILIKRKK